MRSLAGAFHAVLGVTLAILVLLTAARPAAANSWAENGDAGDLTTTAQVTYGTGALTAITGTLSSDSDVDMFCIQVLDPVNFAAWLNCLTLSDKDLWIFDAAGYGIARDRGCQAGQTRVGAPIVTSGGTYYLAVSGNDASARNSGSDLWQLGVPITGQAAPNGPAAGQVLTGWSGGTVNSAGYTIQLIGAGFCDTPLPARSRTWGATKLIYR